MQKLIHWSKIWDLMQRNDSKGAPMPFHLKYAKKSTGEINECERCTLTSIHTIGSTINILPEGESRPKTIRKVLIVEFNHHRVYI